MTGQGQVVCILFCFHIEKKTSRCLKFVLFSIPNFFFFPVHLYHSQMIMMLRSISRFVLVNQRHANLALKRSVHQNHVMNTLVKRLGDFKWSSSSSSSSLMMITRGIKTTSKKDETYVEVFDPEYINEKKPKGPETAEEFADVSSQKV